MSIKNFKFVSPGVFINEIDNSQLPNEPTARGPVIIGRTERGPAMVPYQVDSFAEFVRVFGNPIPGNGGADAWRNGNKAGPTYASYAAQAWLANNSPVTMVRLLGTQNPDNDGTDLGKAGWKTTNALGTELSNGGCYGLFMIDTEMSTTDAQGVASTDVSNFGIVPSNSGTLAAVWYLNSGVIQLSGTSGISSSLDAADTSLVEHSGTNVFIHSVGQRKFKASILDSAGALVEDVVFDFNENSDTYIRKVFNTDPVSTNSTVTSDAKTYWLGETYERAAADHCTGSNQWGVMLALSPVSDDTTGWENRQYAMQYSKTGWFFAQDTRATEASSGTYSENVLDPIYQPSNMQKLFRFQSLEPGSWLQENLKISIENIKASTNKSNPYGSFTVRLRKIEDSDLAIQTVEIFANCNLNPNSENYIARRIGDQYRSWQDDDKRYITIGTYSNKSKFIRVEMNTDVDSKGPQPAELVPFGVFGHPRFQGFGFASGNVAPLSITGTRGPNAILSSGTYTPSTTVLRPYGFGGIGPTGEGPGQATNNFVCFTSSLPTVESGLLPYSGAMVYPAIPLRSGAFSPAVNSPKNAYFGANTLRASSNNEFAKSCKDILRSLPATVAGWGHNPDDSYVEWAWRFSLDDLSASSDGGSVNCSYVSGSRAAGYSTTARSGSYTAILDKGFNKFTTVFYGGFEGLRIDEAEPFRNSFLSEGAGGATELTNYAVNSVVRAIESVKNPEVVDFNLAVMPGITNSTLADRLVDTCEDRGDSMAIIDLPGGYTPDTEGTDAESARLGSVSTTIDTLADRGLNSSYACAYYPWVQVRDSLNNSILWMPPSVVGLGTMSFSERKQELWFAPAGFTRGGLSQGAAGLPVVGVRQQLTADERDDLYEANINPIASFPNEGIVIFGQKTLQVTPSALDRINVRRLLIYVKKRISSMANDILFDQNTITTWNRFLGRANPFLDSVRSRLGLEDFKVILDNTTTTPEMRDRNIIYAKVFLKPTKAVEFIAIDFTITNSGASFED